MDDRIVEEFLRSPREGRLALSASLKNFIAFFHWYMYHQQFEFKYFHKLIIKKLEDIAFGRAEKKNLVINISPRFGKSTIMKYFCAWSYMVNPQSNCIYTSYSDDLANSFSKDIRDIVTSEAFVKLTGMRLNKSKSGADYWATSVGGGFRAAPMGGSIIGFGFGWSGEGYGGCCFPYNEMVWTERGKRRIGELVRKKSKVRVWSFNGKEFELQPIENWIKIPDAEIWRIEMSDGGHIDCTPDHKFYTKRGYVEARDLTKDDILFGFSDEYLVDKPLRGFRHCSPLFVSKIWHRNFSYCLTVRNNHNMLVGKREGYLVSNCLVDDPNKGTSAKSQAELQNTIDYYLNSIKTRANNQTKSPIILIMQRIALEDLTGYVLENEKDNWDLIKIPALNEETGEALWSERISAEELLRIKEATPHVYYGMYQQEPIVLGGSVIKTEWFRYYNPSEEYSYQFTYITSDTAQKKGEANDFSVFSFWGKTFDNKLHLLDMVRGKWEADELRQQVKLCWEKWSHFKTPPYGFYIEDKSSGIGVLQEVRKTDPIPLLPIARARFKNDQGVMVAADKFSRVMTMNPYLVNGWVYLPNSEKDVISGQLLAECAAFRADLGHKHDDAVDCLADAVDIAFGASGVSSLFI